MNTAKRLVISAAICAPLVLLAGCSREPAFDADRITADVRVLSADDFGGRAPASEGEGKTVAFLIQQMEAAGLKPGGDAAADGSRAWTQDVPLLRSEITGPIAVSVRVGKDEIPWTQGEQVALRAAQTGTDHVQLASLPLVFVGYGVSAPERQWDDFKGIDLKGKVALILVNDPDFETGEGDFGGKAMTYYGRWTYKYEEAARRGAAGALVIHETEPASYGWATVKNSNTAEMFDVLRANPLADHVPVEGWIQRDVAGDLLKRAGLDFESLKARARTREFQPVILPDTRISIDYAVKQTKVVSKNVIGVLPGSKYPDEWVLYTAHWDHLGVIPDAKGGDAIYNGAVDNAAGTAQLLEVARTFAKARQTERSLAFAFVTAEEKGLLGSEYYAMNPVYPLAKTVANLNTDAPRPLAPAKDFSTAGDAPSTLQDILIEVGRKYDRSFTPESRPEAGYFFRSDHFSLAKRGVPAISFRSGGELKDGDDGAGKAWDDAYRADRYHQPADEIGEDWRSDGIAADGQLLYSLGRKLADSHVWPEWKQGAEFKAARDASAAERK
jgi:Zn-dependent M28 family amino/carboxypeptidase